MKKTCRKCGDRLSIDDFYKHRDMRDGHLNICKPCVQSAVRRRRRLDDSVREYDRMRSKLPHRKAKAMQVTKKRRQGNPIKYKANTAVGNAIRDRRLTKEPCYFCGTDKRLQAHHHDYNKPLDVIWLCVRCHHRLHAIEHMKSGQIGN